MIADAELILRACGIGTYLHVGCGQSSLVLELLKRSLDAYGVDPSEERVEQLQEHAPGRFLVGSLHNYPFKPETFDTVIVGDELFDFTMADLPILLKNLLQMTKRNLVLYFPIGAAHKQQAGREKLSRLYWEKILIAAGFRRHPRGMLIVPYDQHENEQLVGLTFFERVPAAALEKYPLSWLLANRDLHMDMLREAGRRSDGHVSRYVLAALRAVRAGDTVLDAACGLGYGTAVLAACSPGARFIGVDIDPDSVAYAQVNFAATNPAISYQACDVTRLTFLADHSIDTVVSFETIEHVENYEAFLAEVKRVLKPDGRFIGCVPNLWCDDTGKDPNPYHFHVFDWNKLKDAINKYLVVDGRWGQCAGGGYKLAHRKRDIWNVALNQTQPVETEWWIISACADPSSVKLPYTNPFAKGESDQLPVHISFEKYYDNPWLYRVMVQLGERLTDVNILAKFCEKTAQNARAGSADQGAAICVIAYQLLESGNVTVTAVKALLDGMNVFDNAYDRNNPHAHRWAISLHYIAGRLMLAVGSREDALTTFLACADMDPLKFCPLLATKTISSCMYAGLLYAGNGKIEEARAQFRRGVKEAHRVLQGDWKDITGSMDDPLLFGLPEAAEVIEIASQCAQALRVLDKQETVPGYVWDRVNLRRFGLVEWNKSLERENSILRQILTESSLAASPA